MTNSTDPSNSVATAARLQQVVRDTWGFDTLRPHQQEAMIAAMERRDALLVLPTGGGKSLCYQAPALLTDQLTVVVSPLISLMKDQVDHLTRVGVPALFLNSSLSPGERRTVVQKVRARQCRLLFVAPERFASEPFWDLLAEADVGCFAVDEAHCISHWGHDFRDDYRKLGQLKTRFPEAAVHAFTATATPQVREDIVNQLRLHEPSILVGDFFRPNLNFTVQRRGSGWRDLLGLLSNRRGQAGIIYCIRRRDVDELSGQLQAAGWPVAGYHAGMSDEERVRVQDAFTAKEVNLIVATVAFGMGIDRRDIRFVIHAAMPKSIEHYQQESGRAGRDGEPADCILLYSGSDYHTWKRITEGGESDPQHALDCLSDMYNYCTAVSCRHQALVSYFGQVWNRRNCAACDVCSGTREALPDSTVVAQKIMSAIVRTGEIFGAAHIRDVLIGHETEKVMAREHDQLPTFAALCDHDPREVRNWIDQLVSQDALYRDGQYQSLKLTDEGWRVLRGEAEARLYEVEQAKPARRLRRRDHARIALTDPAITERLVRGDALTGPESLEEADGRLYEHLRQLRATLAKAESLRAFMVFSNRTLAAIASARPRSEDELMAVKGVGPAKAARYGEAFLASIQEYVGESADG